MKTIYLAGGCFWGTEHFISQFKGVLSTEVGYANGRTANPSYEEVRYSDTGHAETVRVEFDENVISARRLVEYYFLTIDPLSVNRQGEDAGTQYRTGIYYDDASLLPDIEAVLHEKEQELGQKLTVVATGGLAGSIIPLCNHRILLDDELLLKGLLLIYEKNR